MCPAREPRRRNEPLRSWISIRGTQWGGLKGSGCEFTSPRPPQIDGVQ